MSFEPLFDFVRETALLQSTSDLLEWDERTCLPPQGGEYRAEQITFLAGIIHARRTDPRIGEWLAGAESAEVAEDAAADIRGTLRCLNREYERACKLPTELVKALSRATVIGQQRWEAARRDDDYAAFEPALKEIIQLRREEAQCLCEGGDLYDALLDEYEEGATGAELEELFVDLREAIVPLIGELREAPHPPNIDILRRSFPIVRQRQLSRMAAERIGFDFTRGRLDETTHPFCTSLGPADCRILTRYDQHWLPGGLFGTLHEAGHGLYDQGLRSDWFGLPPGTFVSLGIHESQSRLWENLVGRSQSFWAHFYDETQQLFPDALCDVGLDSFYRAVNTVSPSLIRVEADEVTYNLHIIIRFELERALLYGDLSTADLPATWREKYDEYLGNTPPNNALGVLQDVHWSAGLFGYFPTYAIGNLIASQLYEAAERELGDLDRMSARGQFGPLLGWLRDNIYCHGSNFPPRQLVEQATRNALTAEPLKRHLTQKYRAVYHL